MDRVIVDGHVAVLYSPGHGAGWSSWNIEYSTEELIFDPGLVDLVLTGREHEEIVVYATLKWPDACVLGLSDLDVEWVPVGTKFQIGEYDGHESVNVFDEEDWLIA
jgi:hypothetical protein